MAKILQLRRGTTAEHNTFTGAIGELTMVTDTNTLRIHDGTTVGGNEMTGGQFLGAATIKGIQYMAQTTDENLTVVAGTNAFSIDSLEVLNNGSITVENNAVYKVL